LALGRNFRSFLAISRADIEEPNRWENEKMKGILFFDSKKYEKALQCLVNSFNANTKDHLYKPFPRDDAGTWNLIGECFYSRGVYDKASTAFKMASDTVSDEHQKKFFGDRASLMLDMLGGRK
jgi:tetratricopeptide (TPR) repeat protein